MQSSCLKGSFPNCTAVATATWLSCQLAQAMRQSEGKVGGFTVENPTKLQPKCSERAKCGKKAVQGSTFKMCFSFFVLFTVQLRELC